MEKAIQSNQMDLDKEEIRQEQCLPSLPQERHIWRMPELPPVPTNFDVNSEPEIIEGNILRAEPLPSGSHRNILVPIPKLVQRRKRRGVGNTPKPLAGGHELLLTNQEKTIELLGGWSSLSCKELVEEPKYFICRPEGIGNDSSFGRRPSGIYQLQIEAQKTSEEEEMSQEPSGQGQGQRKLAQTLPTRGQDSYGIHSQRAGKDKQALSTQIIKEIQFVKYSIY
ncbi:hypothetical protein O181_043848 [Austropuccinia psidii MF-1]|uniref:Uncharacterized protein n=1 Tax=Austropuccinia psidii MF-1 TaxID=1389203 RepID=A0A9Q3DNZ5_9BASI|nr:hypothetical protein [Austropuccinia psidii MF-1]